VLLNIFRYYLDTSPRFWPRLTHICRKWRRIVFASQRALHLRLLCTHGTPVLKTLDCWPTLSIVVQYGGPPVPSLPATKDEDNIVAALKQSDRISSISLIVTNSFLEKLSTIRVERPFSELEELVLLSQDSVSLTLPIAFRWGLRLRTLHLTRVAIPTLLELLSLSEGLVDLQLHEILELGYFSPDAFVDALSAMTQLRSLSLSLHFLSFSLPRNYVRLPPQSRERVILPALMSLKYRGTSKHLVSFVDRVDAPRLGYVEIRFFSPPSKNTSRLARFINRIELQKSHRRADILASEHAVSISFTQPEAPSRLELQIFCKPLSRQLSYMAQICNELSACLLVVEHLRISVTLTKSGKDDSNRQGWLKLTRPFIGTKWVHLSGRPSTNIVLALQHSQMQRETMLPALCKLCIRRPEPHYAPLQDAVVSFIHSCRLSGRVIAVEYERLWIEGLLGTGMMFVQCPFLSRTNAIGAGPLPQQVMIEMLSDDVLLNIFRHYLHDYPQFWHTLTHVCQKWRQIVLASPLGLHLRLHCTYGTPVSKNLKYWPPFPLVVNYGGRPGFSPPVREDEDNMMAALEQSDRVRSIGLTISTSLLKKLSALSKPFSEIEELFLVSQDNLQLTVPNTFWWGYRLRTFHSIRIAFASLPQHLLPSQNLVNLQLDEIPGVGYFSPEAFANALCGMIRLQSLSLHFLSLPSRRNYLSLPPSPGDRVFLPALTRLKYRGTSKYLDNLVARIDALRLRDIDITFFSQPTLDASQLGLFINRIELWESPLRADILSSRNSISMSISQPKALTQFGLQISCNQFDWQLSSISQICDHFSSSLFSVEDLRIEMAGPSSVPDDMDDEQWPQLIRAFGGAKDFHMASELATDISRALRLADEGHEIVLPTLINLHVLQPVSTSGPLWDSVESFVTQRQLSSLPVQIYVQQGPGEESIPVAMWRETHDGGPESVYESPILLSPLFESPTLTEGVEMTTQGSVAEWRLRQSRLPPDALTIPQSPPESVLSSLSDFPLSSATSLQSRMGRFSP
jgi:hypothetical protein